MNRDSLYISTTATDAPEIARQYGLGIEIAEYCTAWNMDAEFRSTDTALRSKLEGIKGRVLHAPFNELFPCAIDPKARKLAEERYRQAIALAKRYGAGKVVIHGGYHPWMYYPEWYVEQSILFWKAFLKEDPSVKIVLENVLEADPRWLVRILDEVDDDRLGMCLDIGHVNAYSAVPVRKWLEICASHISHFHIHNNDGHSDQHNALDMGTIPVGEFLREANRVCPRATFTLEVMEGESSLRWLLDNGFL